MKAQTSQPEPGGAILVGLGPGDPASLTREAEDALSEAAEVVLGAGAPARALPRGTPHTSLDGGSGAVKELVRLARRKRGVVYATLGHPLLDDATALAFCREAQERNLPVRIVAGVSLLDAALLAAGAEAGAGLQVLDASAVEASQPLINPQRQLIVTGLGAADTREAADALRRIYPPDVSCVAVRFERGVASAKEVPLSKAGRSGRVDALYIPALPPADDVRTFAGLRWIVGQLRKNCPWDRQQTHESLKGYLLEETYEALAKLDEGDTKGLSEELGDLLLQVLLHAEIAVEAGEFLFEDVMERIATKLVRRHPHVFGGVEVESAEDVATNWEAIKRKERGAQHLLDGVPLSMPALAQAQSLQDRAARTGFEWERTRQALARLAQEMVEMSRASTPQERLEELGDILFAMASVARRMEIDAEEALRLATRKFRERFARMEKLASKRGAALEGVSLDDLLNLWREARPTR